MHFCNKCHKIINVPDFLKQVKAEQGLTIKCGQPNCKGSAIIKNKETKNEIHN